MSNTIEATFVPKISTKKIGIIADDIQAAVKKSPKTPVSLFLVYGMVSDVKYGSTDKGEWTRFQGQFEAVNKLTGEIFRSGSMFLPPAITPFLEGQVIQAKKTEGFVGMQFGIDVQVIKSDVPIGYEYRPVNIVQGTEENDPLLAMRKAMNIPKLKK